ncbi:MAG TPA: hypothetical protein VLI94_10005 [Solirubrobacterales bacterium]|nr:hypothetical protein [Solirubrobacterales bacterium]
MTIRAFALLLLCAFVFTACGEEGGDEEAAVKKMIVTSANSDNPEDCTRLLTPNYLEQSTKLEGEAAVTACEEQAVDPNLEIPRKVIVSGVEIDSSSATATVAFTGSGYDGQTVRLALVERGGRWKWHEILGFINLDAEKLVTEMGREMLLRNETSFEAESTSCFVGILDEMSDQALEALVLDASLDRFLALANRCYIRSGAL